MGDEEAGVGCDSDFGKSKVYKAGHISCIFFYNALYVLHSVCRFRLLLGKQGGRSKWAAELNACAATLVGNGVREELSYDFRRLRGQRGVQQQCE